MVFVITYSQDNGNWISGLLDKVQDETCPRDRISAAMDDVDGQDIGHLRKNTSKMGMKKRLSYR